MKSLVTTMLVFPSLHNKTSVRTVFMLAKSSSINIRKNRSLYSLTYGTVCFSQFYVFTACCCCCCCLPALFLLLYFHHSLSPLCTALALLLFSSSLFCLCLCFVVVFVCECVCVSIAWIRLVSLLVCIVHFVCTTTRKQRPCRVYSMVYSGATGGWNAYSGILIANGAHTYTAKTYALCVSLILLIHQNVLYASEYSFKACK